VSASRQLLLEVLAQAFDRRSWHGPNLAGSLRGLSPVERAWRPAPGRHNAWEIAVHAAYWKYTVWRQLTGAKRGSFTLVGSDWFERPAGGATWAADAALLEHWHHRLLEAVRGAPTSSWNERRRWLVSGIAAHDLYHAGQIQLLKRLQRGRRRRP
jgi:hypothetical protein